MLTREEILNALSTLSDELGALDLHGEILLTGGASMCLVHSARDMTKDIDALYEPKNTINKLISKIAETNDLPADWLNDSVKGFLSEAVPQEEYLMLPHLRVSTVSADYLLAMKLMSARYGETDYEDIRFLMDKLDLYTKNDLEDALLRFYPIEQILPKTEYLIEQLINESP